MSLPETVYDALKAVMTNETRFSYLTEKVAALSDRVESHASQFSAVLQNHAERLSRLEGKFELLETSLSGRRRKLPE